MQTLLDYPFNNTNSFKINCRFQEAYSLIYEEDSLFESLGGYYHVKIPLSRYKD